MAQREFPFSSITFPWNNNQKSFIRFISLFVNSIAQQNFWYYSYIIVHDLILIFNIFKKKLLKWCSTPMRTVSSHLILVVKTISTRWKYKLHHNRLSMHFHRFVGIHILCSFFFNESFGFQKDSKSKNNLVKSSFRRSLMHSHQLCFKLLC